MMDNTPAFPVYDGSKHDGMTMRQWYKGQVAGKIVSALMLKLERRNDINEYQNAEIEAIKKADWMSCMLADAMLAEDAKHEAAESIKGK